MKKTKAAILILSNSWGGAEESVFNIARYINKKDLSLTLFVNKFLYERYKEIKNIEIVNLGTYNSDNKIKKACSLAKVAISLFDQSKKQKIGVLHIQLESSILAYWYIRRLLKMPIVLTLRGDEARIYQDPKSLEQKIISSAIFSILNVKRNCVTSVSKWLVKDFDERDRSKIIITPNGIDLERFKPVKVKKIKESILYVGRFVPGKGIEDLVKIAGILKEYEFFFVGRGELSGLMILKNTHDLGFKLYDEIIRLYSKVEICVFPSYAEGMPMVGLEAMACECPVIASEAGFSDYIDNGADGVIIKAGNIDMIKNRILRLMKNKSLRIKIGRNARRKALNYDINKTVDNYLRLYKKMGIR